jgi:hypothetical protein
MRIMKTLIGGGFVAIMAMTANSLAAPSDGMVIEVVTFKLKPGVSASEFAPVDKAVEVQHVAKQAGFVSRESAAGEGGEWLVIVHWRSVENAEASMGDLREGTRRGELHVQDRRGDDDHEALSAMNRAGPFAGGVGPRSARCFRWRVLGD